MIEARAIWLWLAIGAINCFFAVAMGAMGSHMIAMSPKDAATFKTASDYQMWHGLAIVVFALWLRQAPGRAFTLASWLFFAGILLFCGSLYLIAVTGTRELGIVAPFGGTLLLAGWLVVVVAAIRRAR